MTAVTVILPSPNQGLQSDVHETLNRTKPQEQNVVLKPATGKVKKSKRKPSVFTHGLRHLQHFSCDSPVRFMMYSEAAAAFISLHSDNTVSLYTSESHKHISSARLTFTGLTETKTRGLLVGWGPGPVFTLLDNKLHPFETACDALDIRVCQAAEHSREIVTAGAGNVCVWSVFLMRCMVKVEEGLQHGTFTQMALSPPRFERPHRAFVVCGRPVTVIDLNGGKVLEHKKDLCSGDITAMVFCSQLDCLITASQELSVQVWGPDWEQHAVLQGCNGVVISLFYCSSSNMLLSAAKDCTIHCWNMEEGDAVECVHTEQKNPPLGIGRRGDTFFSYSQQGVDFWSIRNLYNLSCKVRGDEKAPLRQILVTSFPAPFPSRVLCISGDRNITLVAAETREVLTSLKAQERVLCADYCLQKEILFALTETGTVLQANTLTNPVTVMQEWKGKGQGPWQLKGSLAEKDTHNLPAPGPACCLVLYCYVTETEDALEEWKSLQDRRGCTERNKKSLDDAKNIFFIILGQSGGCVSALKFSDGKVLCRVPAHNGQRVTAVHVYPENACFISTGEDMTVVVWSVNCFVQECLTPKMSLPCGQSSIHLAVLGPQLALTFQEPASGTYKPIHFNLLNQSRTDGPRTEGHLDHITGLCACPDLEVFVSSSLDRTLRIWNEENQLLSTLQLNAVPQCLAYGGFGGDLLIGIRGDLCKIDCADFLPHIYHQRLLHTYSVQRVPDFPAIKDQEVCSKIKSPSTDKDEEEELQAITGNLLPTKDMWRQKEHGGLNTLNKDLSALIEGSVKCRKEKLPGTKKTKKEAFDRYMKILYGFPLNMKLDVGDTFDSDKLSFDPEPRDYKLFKPDKPPAPESESPVIAEPVQEEKKAPKRRSKPKTLISIKDLPVQRVTPKTPIIVERQQEEEPPESPPIDPPKPTPPTPRPGQWQRTPTTPLPPPEPTTEVSAFLKQFLKADWLIELFPDKKCIPSTLSPEDVSLQLLDSLSTCDVSTKMKILTALKALFKHELLSNTDKLYQGLLDLVSKLVRPHMSALEQAVLAELLNLLVQLKSVDNNLMKNVLSLLAFKKLGLRKEVFGMLTAMGVNEAEQWLWPELKNWDSGLQDHATIWKILHDRADQWLELWISKYKEHGRNLYLRSTAKWKPPTFIAVDVLNYFCSVQEAEHRKAQCVMPAGRKSALLLPLFDCSSQPILPLGETHSMARIWKPPEILLPPLRHRPFLTRFPSFISLPLSRVTLSPFHIYTDKDWVKASTRRYFIHRQSYVEYYR